MLFSSHTCLYQTARTIAGKFTHLFLLTKSKSTSPNKPSIHGETGLAMDKIWDTLCYRLWSQLDWGNLHKRKRRKKEDDVDSCSRQNSTSCKLHSVWTGFEQRPVKQRKCLYSPDNSSCCVAWNQEGGKKFSINKEIHCKSGWYEKSLHWLDKVHCKHKEGIMSFWVWK